MMSDSNSNTTGSPVGTLLKQAQSHLKSDPHAAYTHIRKILAIEPSHLEALALMQQLQISDTSDRSTEIQQCFTDLVAGSSSPIDVLERYTSSPNNASIFIIKYTVAELISPQILRKSINILANLTRANSAASAIKLQTVLISSSFFRLAIAGPEPDLKKTISIIVDSCLNSHRLDPNFDTTESQTTIMRACIDEITATNPALSKTMLNCILPLLAIKDSPSVFMKAVTDTDRFRKLASVSSTSELRLLVSACFSKCAEILQTDPYSKKTTGLVKNLVFASSNVEKIQGLNSLHVLFNSVPGLAIGILRDSSGDGGMLAEIMEVVEFETFEVQVGAAEMLASACCDSKTAKSVALHCTDFLVNAWRATGPHQHGLKKASAFVLSKIMMMSLERLENEIEALFALLRSVVLEASGDLGVAVEAVAYISLHPKIKNIVAYDLVFLRCLFGHSGSDDEPLRYGIALILGNVTAVPREMSDDQVQLRKLQKMSLPTSQQKTGAAEVETLANVQKRVDFMVDCGLVASIVSLAKSNRDLVKHQVAKCLHSVSLSQKHRGGMIQLGCCRVLLTTYKVEDATVKETDTMSSDLNRDGNSSTKMISAQALAKLTITTNPSLAFRGEMIYEVIRPLLHLLSAEHGLLQFEGLMALTNLASVGPPLCEKINEMGGVKMIETLQFNDNLLIRRASTEALCNLMNSPSIGKMYVDGRLNIAVMVALSDSDDFQTRRAASGALAILCGGFDGAKEVVLKQNRIGEILAGLVEDENEEIGARGAALFEALK